MKSRVPVLVVVACLVLAFIAFEVHSVVSALKQGAAAGSGEGGTTQGGAAGSSQRGQGGPGGGPDLPDPGEPTIAYPELCHGLVMLDKSKELKLSDEEKKKILPQLEELSRISDKMHSAERDLFNALTPAQKKWVQEHREELMKASIQPGKPPIAFALYHFNGGKGVESRNTHKPEGGGQGGNGMTPTPPADPRIPPPSQGGPSTAPTPPGAASSATPAAAAPGVQASVAPAAATPPDARTPAASGRP